MKILTTIVLCFLAIPLAQSRTAEEATPLLIGQSTPKVDVMDETGTKQFLPALLKGKYSILVFYRGIR